jgi:hypothetical protein
MCGKKRKREKGRERERRKRKKNINKDTKKNLARALLYVFPPYAVVCGQLVCLFLSAGEREKGEGEGKGRVSLVGDCGGQQC